MSRFVILRHEPGPASSRGLHWDLMLEVGDTLRTWALQSEPGGRQRVEARRLADHRRVYLNYEGPVSRGRGVVARWDAGSYELLSCSDEHWVVTLNGTRLCGTLTLTAVREPLWEASYCPRSNGRQP